jgi:hypothetical protein
MALTIDYDSMACIIPSRISDAVVDIAAKSVDSFPFSFIAPLGSHHD